MTESLTITVPDDFHLHLRCGAMLRAVLPFTARHFPRALIMPNRPWVHDADTMIAYRDEIRRAAEVSGFPAFQPLMTVAIEDNTTPKVIQAARHAGAVAAKLYPLGATTGPESGGARGVADPMAERMLEVYRAMTDCGMVLCVHAESPSPCPRLLRESDYLPVVEFIARKYSGLKVVIEHISDLEAALLVREGLPNLAATITAHHLIDTVDDALESPHHNCNPVPKTEDDRDDGLWDLIETGHPRVFFGSDSAPHSVSAKHCARPACGCFSAPGLLPRLTGMFEERGMLDRLEGFVAHHGADFYGVTRNEGTVTLSRQPMEVPVLVAVDRTDVVVWRGGDTLAWSVEEATP